MRATPPSNRRWRMRGGRRPSGSGVTKARAAAHYDWNTTTNSGEFSANSGLLQQQQPVQPASSVGPASLQRGPSKRTILGGQGPQGAYRVTGQEACSGLTGPLSMEKILRHRLYPVSKRDPTSQRPEGVPPEGQLCDGPD